MTEPHPGDLRASGAMVPVPDPTVLTQQAVDRAISAYREVVDTRIEGMDQATRLIAAELVKIEKASDESHRRIWDNHVRGMVAEREFILARLSNVAEVSDERFAAIATQFGERDTRTEQAAQESRISLDAALAAAKEAVSEQNKANALAIGKSEDATKERLDALGLLMTSGVEELRRQLSEVKSRIDRGEAGGEAKQHARTEERLNVGQVLVAVSILIAAVGLFLNALRR
jgi:hypothetical protein